MWFESKLKTKLSFIKSLKTNLINHESNKITISNYDPRICNDDNWLQ